MIRTHLRKLTVAEAHVLALLKITGPCTDEHLPFLYIFLDSGPHWTPLEDCELIAAREALARDGLLVEVAGRGEWQVAEGAL
jgi:hypothetical protein